MNICIRCKGTRMMCGKTVCPQIEKAKARAKLLPNLSADMAGYSSGVFVGRVGYPRVFTGPMIAMENVQNMDLPEQWYGTPLEKLVDMRYQLVRSKELLDIGSARDPSRDLMSMQDLAMSTKNVDTEAHFKRQPRIETSLSAVSAPYGSSGELKSFSITENPRIPRQVDKVVSDELKAAEGMELLYKSAPVSQISKILSVDLLGLDKKLVPTRWSITATDDTLGKKMIAEVKDCPEVGEYQLFSSYYLGNHFEILLMPSKWGFENLECYVPGNIWTEGAKETEFMVDWEPYEGRTKYASNVTGGYYAARLAVLERLRTVRRQANAIVVREITPEYWCPVGVWQIRENVRAAMNRPAMKFRELEPALREIGDRCGINRIWEPHSELLKRERSRSILRQYL